MTEEKIKLPIRSALIPVFYQNFHCLGQKCRDNCCVNCNITFDKKDYLRLRRLDAPPALKERLERSVRRVKKGNNASTNYARFDRDTNNRCPFLDPDGLCAIQRDCGHKALPATCKTYPRKNGYTIAAKEYTLSPSCEGVLQQLWDLPEGVEFVEDPLPKAEQRNANITPGEGLTLCFAPLRGLCVDILQNRELSLTERMLCLGVVLQRLQKEDWENFDPDRWVEQTASLIAPEMIQKMCADIEGNQDIFLIQNINALNMISESEKDWPIEICKALEITATPKADNEADQNAHVAINFSPKAYEDALTQFQATFSDYEYFFENLMVAVVLYLSFPKLNSKEELWKSYVSLCNLYSFYRFVSVLGCKDEATKERLFHMIVMASRATLHNRERFNGYQEDLFRHDSSTLAHMAILLRWD